MNIERDISKYGSKKSDVNEKIVLEHRTSFEKSGKEIGILRPARRSPIVGEILELATVSVLVTGFIVGAAVLYNERTEPADPNPVSPTPITLQK